MTDEAAVTNINMPTYDSESDDAHSVSTSRGGNKRYSVEQMETLQQANSPLSIVIADAKVHGTDPAHYRIIRRLHLDAMRGKVAAAEQMAKDSDEAVDRIVSSLWTLPLLTENKQ